MAKRSGPGTVEQIKAALDEACKDPVIAEQVKAACLEQMPKTISALFELAQTAKDAEVRTKAKALLMVHGRAILLDSEGGRRREVFERIAMEHPELVRMVLGDDEIH